MKFYNREKELQRLRSIEQSAQRTSKMTVLVGRRRMCRKLTAGGRSVEKTPLVVFKLLCAQC